MGIEQTFTRIHLVRHGEVAEEWKPRIYGRHDVPLSEQGVRQAARAAARLRSRPLAAVISTGLARTEVGAEMLRAPLGLSARVERDLIEIDRGSWVGRTFEEVDREENGAWTAWTLDPERLRPPQGESLTDLVARVLPRLDALASEYSGAEIALVAHSWVVRAAVCHVLGLSLSVAPRLAATTGSITSLDWQAPEHGSARVLAAFCVDVPPERGGTWYRGPR